MVAVWTDERAVTSTQLDLFAIRITADGQRAAGWDSNGTAVAVVPGRQDCPVIAPDGSGGVYIAWDDERGGGGFNERDIYAQHLLGDGSIAPGWPANGLAIASAPGFQGTPRIASDGQGGALIVWTDTRNGTHDIFGSRVRGDGTLAPGWTPNGTLLLGSPIADTADDLAADGTGNFILGIRTLVAFQEDSQNLFALRITPDGQPMPGWPATGAVLCNAANWQTDLRIAPDGSGGLFAVWQDFRNWNDDIYGQHLLADGSIAPGWPFNGMPVISATPASEAVGTVIPDGAGGAYVAGESGFNDWILAQRITAGGQSAPGWLNGGQIIAAPARKPRMVPDGEGGAIVAFEFGNSIGAHKLVPDGPVPVQVALVESEATSERVRLTWQLAEHALPEVAVYRRTELQGWRWQRTVAVDGVGHVHFEDRDVVAGERYAYRLGWGEDGAERFSVETWIEVPVSVDLALAGFTPNPSRGVLTVAFALPDASPATLELLDVTGRRVAMREVGSLGAGSHHVTLANGVRVTPGVYFVRLVRTDRVLLVRGAVIR